MRIWIIDHYSVPPMYYPLARNTIFAKKLINLGNSVKVFAASTVHNSNINLINIDSLYQEIYYEDVNYVLINCHNYTGNGIIRMINMLEFAYKLPIVCNKFERPDVIISTSMTLFACAQGIRLSKKYKCKCIAQITDLWPETIVSYGVASRYNPIIYLLYKLEKWIYVNSDRVVFSMEGAYNYIEERQLDKFIPKNKVCFINNGVDLDNFNYNKIHYTFKDDDLDGDDFKVVYTGSIRTVNNVGALLDVAKLLPLNIKILIWGNGDEKERLKERIIEENIKNVILKDGVEKKYIPYIVSKSDLNLVHNNCTSLFRFGISFNKIFDYLAAGKPILCTFSCPYNPVISYMAGTDIKVSTARNIANEILKFSEMSEGLYNYYCNNAKNASYKYDFNVLTKMLIQCIKDI